MYERGTMYRRIRYELYEQYHRKYTYSCVAFDHHHCRSVQRLDGASCLPRMTSSPINQRCLNLYGTMIESSGRQTANAIPKLCLTHNTQLDKSPKSMGTRFSARGIVTLE